MKARPIFWAGLVLAGLIFAGSARAQDNEAIQVECTASLVFAAVRTEDRYGADDPAVELTYSVARLWGADLDEDKVVARLQQMHDDEVPWTRIEQQAERCSRAAERWIASQ